MMLNDKTLLCVTETREYKTLITSKMCRNSTVMSGLYAKVYWPLHTVFRRNMLEYIRREVMNG